MRKFKTFLDEPNEPEDDFNLISAILCLVAVAIVSLTIIFG